MIVVDENQFVEVEYRIYNPGAPDSIVTFSSFAAILDTITEELEPKVTELEDIPEGLEGFSIEQAFLDLTLTSTIGVEVPLNIELYAYKSGVLQDSLVFDVFVPLGSKNSPTTTVFNIAGAEKIINVIPDQIEIKGRYQIFGEVSLNDDNYKLSWVEGSYLLYSPFALSVTEDTYFEPEMATIDEGFENSVAQITLTMNLENHMPLAGEAMIIASNDSTQFDLSNPVGVDTLFRVGLPDPVIGEDGYVAQSGICSVPQEMNEERILLFADASEEIPLYLQTKIIIFNTGDDTVRARPGDFISVGASAHVIVDVDFDDDEEGEGN